MKMIWHDNVLLDTGNPTQILFYNGAPSGQVATRAAEVCGPYNGTEDGSFFFCADGDEIGTALAVVVIWQA